MYDQYNCNVLHVVSISFSLPYFVGDQFLHFKNKGVQYFVASSDSVHFRKYAVEKQFIPIPITISRSISPLSDLRAIFKLRRIIKQYKIEQVIGHTPKGGMIAMIAATLAGINNRVYFRHGIMFETSKGIKRFLLKKIEQLTGFLAKKVVCVSDSIRDFSNAEYLSKPSKNILLGGGTCNGIDTSIRFNPERYNIVVRNDLRMQWNIPKHDFVFGYVGRLVGDKGIPELIAAWKLILLQHTNIKLLLVGPFEERDALSSDLQTYIRSEASIVFTGLVDKTENFYLMMDTFLLPSHREGFPTVILEASAMELPVITTMVTGCKDAVVDNVTGIFSSHDPVDIAAKMTLFLNDKARASCLGQQGRKWVVENFEQEKIWNYIEHQILNP